MWIWLYKLTGKVYIINDLNHYVGFMKITEDMYWEFKVLPVLTGILIVWGLWVAFVGTRRAFYWWLGYYAVFAAFSLSDFYYRLWQFGHTVDPHAPIRISGYVPPMFGTKHFMNFTISSLPAAGFWVLLAGFIVAVLALLVAWPKAQRARAVAQG
jgi:copper chaperone NosL